MSGTEQLFYLVVVPAAIVAVVWALASLGGPRAQRRYRPGRPYHFAPVWYVANHERTGSGRHAAPTAEPPGGTDEVNSTGQSRTGGVSDRW